MLLVRRVQMGFITLDALGLTLGAVWHVLHVALAPLDLAALGPPLDPVLRVVPLESVLAGFYSGLTHGGATTNLGQMD